jgi:hypothetical protein
LEDSEVETASDKTASDKTAKDKEEPKARAKKTARPKSPRGQGKQSASSKLAAIDQDVSEPAEPEAKESIVESEPEAKEPVGPPADHVVHLYEYGDFVRTIARDFTGEEAVAFAEEFNRTGRAHARQAIAVEKDAEPEGSL